MTVMVVFYLSLLLAINSPSSCVIFVDAFELGSELGSVVSYGSAIDPTGLRMYTTGIDSKGSSTSTLGTSSTETHCYTSVGRVGGNDRRLFQSPPMCLDVYVIKSSSAKTNTGPTNGIVTAMDGNEQPLLYEFVYENYQQQLGQPFVLPNGHFPAVMATDNQFQTQQDNSSQDNGVYIALHPTNGIVNGNTKNVNLESTRDYFRHFTHPKYTTTGAIGDDGYSPIIYKYNMETRDQEWQLLFNTTDGKTLITGMGIVPNNNKLVVFGSTTGYGMTVGAGAKTNGQNWNGFMTWVDISSGTIDLSNYRSETHNSHGTPIRSQRNQDDYVLGACLEGDKAFVVGSTTGKFEGTTNGGGFILKLDTDRFDPTWKRQFVGTGIEFTHCVVQGDYVIVGGTVQPQTQLAPRNGNNAYTEKESVDIVVVKLDKGNGETLFIRQIDSHRDDQLVNMERHPKGTVYLTANAWDFGENGGDGTNDLYVLSIDHRGDHDWYDIEPTIDPISGIDLSASRPVKDNERNAPSSNGVTNNGVAKNGATNNVDSRNSSGGGETFKTDTFVIAIAVPLFLLLIVIVIARCREESMNNNSSAAAKRATMENDDQQQEATTDNHHEGDFDDVESLASENKLH